MFCFSVVEFESGVFESKKPDLSTFADFTFPFPKSGIFVYFRVRSFSDELIDRSDGVSDISSATASAKSLKLSSTN